MASTVSVLTSAPLSNVESPAPDTATDSCTFFLINFLIYIVLNWVILASTPLARVGHRVSITMVYSIAEPGKGSRAAKSVIKKYRNAKFDYIPILELNRKAFICEWLCVHDLLDQYSPGVHSGPSFKLWWAGSAYVFPFVLLHYVYLFSSGSKTGAITVDSDHDYEVAIKALSKKNRDLCQVSIEFDTDCMEGFRIRKQVSIFFSFLNRIFTLFLS